MERGDISTTLPPRMLITFGRVIATPRAPWSSLQAFGGMAPRYDPLGLHLAPQLQVRRDHLPWGGDARRCPAPADPDGGALRQPLGRGRRRAQQAAGHVIRVIREDRTRIFAYGNRGLLVDNPDELRLLVWPTPNACSYPRPSAPASSSTSSTRRSPRSSSSMKSIAKCSGGHASTGPPPTPAQPQAILRERPTYKLTEDTPEPTAYYIEEVWKQYSYDAMVRATTPCAPGHDRPTTKFRRPSACTHGLGSIATQTAAQLPPPTDRTLQAGQQAPRSYLVHPGGTKWSESGISAG